MTRFLIKLFIKDRENVTDNNVRASYGNLGSFVGILCNLFLCILKVIMGSVTGSISITADGLNNLSDMGSSIVTMIGFKLSNKPADSDHPFGHGRMEYLSAFVVSVLILLVGFELLKSSATALINNSAAPKYTLGAIIILAVSILVKLWMFLFNRKLGKTIDSDSLAATAQDSLNDSIATVTILVAALISYFVKLPFNLDAVMGLGVAIFIIISGIGAAKETINRMLGTPPEPQTITDIKDIILAHERFVGIHDLIVHNYGPGRQFASVHVEVPQNVDIVKCHEEIDLCEKEIKTKLGIELVIHMDPIDVDNEAVSGTRQKLAEEIVKINPKLTLHDFRMTPNTDVQTNLIFDVVIPPEMKKETDKLQSKICEIAKGINPTYNCVITFDCDFTGA